MIARYTVLDEDAKRLIILGPYQIHAIEAIREASRNGKSEFVWYTTGSRKTLTSYKATRNLLMDIPKRTHRQVWERCSKYSEKIFCTIASKKTDYNN